MPASESRIMAAMATKQIGASSTAWETRPGFCGGMLPRGCLREGRGGAAQRKGRMEGHDNVSAFKVLAVNVGRHCARSQAGRVSRHGPNRRLDSLAQRFVLIGLRRPRRCWCLGRGHGFLIST